MTKPSNEIIEEAARLAYEEDADHVVGMIDGRWAIAHTEDMGRQAQMAAPKFRVNSSCDLNEIG